MDWFEDWALTLAVFIPLVGAVVMLLIPKAEEELIKAVAVVTSLATLVVGVGILVDFDYDKSGLQFAPKPREWISRACSTVSANRRAGSSAAGCCAFR